MEISWNAIVGLFLSVLISAASSSQGAGEDEFTRSVRLAESSKTRDEKVDHLRQALQARPHSTENIDIEFEIASLLHSTTSPGQPTKPLEALKYYEGILKTYHYEDYYSSNYFEGAPWKVLRQSLFVQSAIQAGCIHIYVLKEEEKGRKYEYQAMEMLKKTFERRRADWLREEEPKMPPTVPAEFEWDEPGRAQEGYKYEVAEWAKRKERARDGDVLERNEFSNAKIAVKHYGLSYGPQSPEMASSVMGQIIKDFPGTPMARIAQEHIDRASKMAVERRSDE